MFPKIKEVRSLAMFKFPDGIQYGKSSRSEGQAGRMRQVQTGKPKIKVGQALIVLLLLTMLLGSDVIFEASQNLVFALFELIEQGTERFFTRVVGLDIYHAQMASAYTYLATGLCVGGWLLRRAYLLGKHGLLIGIYCLAVLHTNVRQIWQISLDSLLVWWQSQDWLNKIALVVALLLVFVPLVALLSWGLGMAVAEAL